MSDELFVGLDVGGTKILAVSIDASGTDGEGPVGAPTVLAHHQVATPATVDALVDRLVDCVAAVAADRSVAAVGVGIPGFMDLHGIARRAPHLGAVVGVDLGAMLRTRLGTHVHVDNDANCAAWAAARIDAPTSHTVVAVTLGTGIGAGLILGGRLWRGAHGFAGEPGHTIVDALGPECACGQHGCWEVWASGAGLARVARREADAGRAPELSAAVHGDLDAIDSPMVTTAATGGSSDALAILERYGWWVAVGLANLVNVIDPDSVILGGGIVAHGDLVLDPIRRQLATFPTIAVPVDVRISTLGPSAGAVGAAMLGGHGLANDIGAAAQL